MLVSDHASTSTLLSTTKKIFEQNPKERIKIHVRPTKAAMEKYGVRFNNPTFFVEAFYDTVYFELMEKNYWLRKRIYNINNKRAKHRVEWSLQKVTEKEPNTISHTDLCVGENKKILEYIQSKSAELEFLLQYSDLEDLQNYASFLTLRIKCKEDYVDHSYFDLDGKETYSVITCIVSALTFSDKLNGAFQPALTKIVEYLRRKKPRLYEKLFQKSQEIETSESEIDPVLMDYFKNKSPGQILLDNINPLAAQYRKSRERYMERFNAVHKKHMPSLITQYPGKWALFVKNKENKPTIKDTYEEALDAASTLKEEYYVMRITTAPLEDTLPKGTCLIYHHGVFQTSKTLYPKEPV